MKYFLILSMGLVLSVSTSLCEAQNIDLSNAKIVLLNPEKKIMANAADMLADEIEKRTRIGLDVVTKMPAKDEIAIVIGTAKDLAKKSYKPATGFEVPQKADAYSLWIDISKRNSATICAAGYDDRGTLYAVGRLLRLLDMGRDTLSLNDNTKITTAPAIGLRGHQQGYRPKTNSYDAWTIDMWEQYYREMVVFGMNAVELIPPRSDDAADSPHFPTPQMEMMVKMSQLADDYGLDVWIWYPAIGNTTGRDWQVIDTDYSDKKIVDAAIEEWGEVFRKLPRIDAVFVPGGDPGRTHPTILLPFMEKQKKNLNKYHPKAQMWVSPQGFDKKHAKGWLRIFLDILQKEQPAWLDGVVFGPQVRMALPDLRKEVPAKYPIRRYPDITHSGGGQHRLKDWDVALRKTLDREPINPRPLGYAKIFRDLQQYSMGFITYSEGCNDDFNKVLWSCLGWDPNMDINKIAIEYSKFFISERYKEKFAEGLFGLERNWVGPVKDNEGIYKTLEMFQEMEKNATPQDKLNWRFQQGLYRAYYDAYVRSRLLYETKLEKRAIQTLSRASQFGSLEAMAKAEAILDEVNSHDPQPQWRARVFELAEALYQSIRMQLSVEKYQAISVRRGANLDNIDVPLNNSKKLKEQFVEIRNLKTEKERLSRIAKIARKK